MSFRNFKSQFFGDRLKHQLTEEEAKTFRTAGLRHASEGMSLYDVFAKGSGGSFLRRQSANFSRLESDAIKQMNELKTRLSDNPAAATIINQIIQDNSRNQLGQQGLVIDHTGTPYGQPSQVGSYY